MPTPIRVAINGFGRTGRAAFRVALKNKRVQIAAINDLTDTKTLASLLKRDTVHGEYSENVGFDKNHVIVNGKKYPVSAEKDPVKLPWKKKKIDVVIESTGRFVRDGLAYAHIDAGAKKCIVSAPDKGKSDIKTFLFGVNDKEYAGEPVISMGSCTTNCVAPVAQIMEKSFGVQKALISTVHSYTANQNLADGPSSDLRKARAAAQNIIPTTTGAAIATTRVLPSLKNKFDGMAFRVPTISGSITDFTFLIKKKTTDKKINNAFKRAAENPQYKKILATTEEPLVSSDIVGKSYSALIDLSLTKVVCGNLVKVLAWYDNEWGYSSRLVDIVIVIGGK